MRNLLLMVIVLLLAFPSATIIEMDANTSSGYVFISADAEHDMKFIQPSTVKKSSSFLMKKNITFFKTQLLVFKSYPTNVSTTFWVGFFNADQFFFSPQMYQSSYLS